MSTCFHFNVFILPRGDLDVLFLILINKLDVSIFFFLHCFVISRNGAPAVYYGDAHDDAPLEAVHFGDEGPV